MKIEVAKNAGFCFGVKNAVEEAYRQLEILAKTGTPLYCLGSLIHNRIVTDELAAKGLITASSIDDIPEGSRVLIRAHGEPDSVYTKAAEKGLILTDATCPFVAKIHRLAREAEAKGRYTLVIGDPAHPEVKPEGKVSFTPISFLLNGTNPIDGKSFYYAVRENTDYSGNAAVTYSNIVFDERILCFKITVSDNGDGTLGFDQQIFELEPATGENMGGKYVLKTDGTNPVNVTPVFANAMEPGTLTVTKYTDGSGDHDKSFPFRIVLTGEDIPTTAELGLTVTISGAYSDNKPLYPDSST